MKIFKRFVLMLVCLSLVLSFGGCGRKTAGGYYVDVEDSSDVVDLDVETNNDGTSTEKNDNNKDESNTSGTDSNNTSSSSKQNTVSGSGNNRTEKDIWKIERNVKPSAKSSYIKNLNLKGKKIRMLVWPEDWSTEDDAKLAAFEKKYNCDIELTVGSYESYFNIISTQLASGKPFDIIKLHRAHFPYAAIAKLVQPLENYIAQEDLTTSYKKPGISWDWTLGNASWDNHIYYTLSGRPCPIPVMGYNKILFQKFGLEDPLTLWKKGEWTLSKIESYAKQVRAADKNMYFYNSTASEFLMRHASTKHPGFYEIDKDGTVTFLGANTVKYNAIVEFRRLNDLSPLSERQARIDTLTSGKCMMHCTSAYVFVTQASSIKASAAFNKNIKNLGIVPLPYMDNGSYYYTGVSGFASSRGCDPVAAIALSVFYSTQDEGWDSDDVPAIKENRELLYSLYDKIDPYSCYNYSFRTAEGKQESDITYQMDEDIAQGGDIMRLLESYAPKVKNMIEYSLSKQ